LKDLIQSVLHDPEFNAADVDHNIHERLMNVCWWCVLVLARFLSPSCCTWQYIDATFIKRGIPIRPIYSKFIYDVVYDNTYNITYDMYYYIYITI
jgi:hypothetical protein